MKNKIELKKYLIRIFLIFLILFSILSFTYFLEYRFITNNLNSKINNIFVHVQKKYPEITKDELMDIINDSRKEPSTLTDYGIDLEKDTVLGQNDQIFFNFFLLQTLLILLLSGSIIYLFLKYHQKRDQELKKITHYIEEINHGNYKLELDEFTEDELSILKSEIYKTTVMLKEQSLNTLEDKIHLKESLSDISHQLKTPLTSILIMLDNLLDIPSMERSMQEEFMRDMKREIVNLNFLVASILKLSKFDANTIHFNQEEVSTDHLIQESIQNVSMLCDLKNIQVKVLEQEKAKVYCDKFWQIEALTNILKNCIEHSLQDGKIEIMIKENKVYTSTIIKDFGEGISKEDLPHIFERFYKGKNATLDSVGIGLALAKTIIERDNGCISVISDSEGTTFHIKYYKK